MNTSNDGWMLSEEFFDLIFDNVNGAVNEMLYRDGYVCYKRKDITDFGTMFLMGGEMG